MLEVPTSIEENARLAELERHVSELRARLDDQVADRERYLSEAFPRVLRQLLQVTNEILPGDVRIEDGTDPEYPKSPSIVFRVAPTTKPNDVNAVIDKEIEWHRAARKVYPQATCHFTLVID